MLSAVDGAVMLLDAAKGLEPQTLKLFEVCRHRGIPVITVVNKWDRPGRDALELMDEITDRIGLRPTPLTWPVGIAGDFRGVLDRRSGEFIRFTRTAGGATVAPEEHLDPATAQAREGEAWVTAVEEHELLDADGAQHDQAAFLAGQTTPVLFASAVQNFGVGQLLNVLLELAPAPTPRPTADGGSRGLDEPFSAFVFKVQAGMDAAHRDRIAFVRVCSGVFERGMVVTHEPTGRPVRHQVRAGGVRPGAHHPGHRLSRRRHRAGERRALGIGDTLYVDEPVRFPPLPSFAPEHFAVARAKDSGRYKQFRRGITQLEQEGVVQVLRSDLRGDQAPVLAAVGPMQFEVATHRMTHEFNAPPSAWSRCPTRLPGAPEEKTQPLSTHCPPSKC